MSPFRIKVTTSTQILNHCVLFFFSVRVIGGYQAHPPTSSTANTTTSSVPTNNPSPISTNSNEAPTPMQTQSAEENARTSNAGEASSEESPSNGYKFIYFSIYFIQSFGKIFLLTQFSYARSEDNKQQVPKRWLKLSSKCVQYKRALNHLFSNTMKYYKTNQLSKKMYVLLIQFTSIKIDS